MTRNDPAKPVQTNLFKVMLRDIVFSGHELVLLKNAIDWKRFEKMLEPAYSDDGRPSCAVRMLAGLTFLKFMFGLSDQEVLDNGCENPYWQDFCGGVFFEHEPPTDQSTMSRWRRKLEKSGGEEMLKETVEAALRNKVAKKSDFTRVNVDTTVQEKNIRFPTDARTLDRARERIVATGEKLGVRFGRTYVRKGKSMLRKHSGYVKAKQFNRAKNAVRTLKAYLSNVVRDAENAKISPSNARETGLLAKLQNYIEISKTLIAQDEHTPGKDRIYSVHEPQVECIAKGKVHKRYEFGVKVGLVTASKTNWILGAQAFPGNPYDGNTMAKALEQSERISGVKPEHAYADLGYRGHDYKGDCDVQIVNRFRKSKSRSLLGWWKRRSAIEPVIGHVKSDNYMERNKLAGKCGDRLCVVLAAVGFNLRKLMRGLKRLFLYLVPETPNGLSTLLVDVMESLCLRIPANRWPTPCCHALRAVA